MEAGRHADGAEHAGQTLRGRLHRPDRVARFFARSGRRSWAIYSAATAAVFLAAFVLTNLAFAQTPGLVAVGGLLQRLCVTTGWTWLTLLALHLWREAADHPAYARPPITSPDSTLTD